MILLFTFGTLPAIAMPLVIAIASILNTFSLIWLLTYITDVSIIVQFLVALVGLGVAIDYALLMIFRFREELRHGADRDTAIAQTMKHAGRSVIVSGSTVAVGLLSMIMLPLPFIRSIGIGGMLIPAVSVLAAITLLPALLYTLGPRHQQPSRACPSASSRAATTRSTGFWNRWAHFVVRRPVPVAAVGLAIVAVLLFYGVQLNPGDAQAKDLPGGGPGPRRALRCSRDAGISDGVHKPFQIVVEGDVHARRSSTQVASTARRDRGDRRRRGAAPARAPTASRSSRRSPTTDGSSRETQRSISRLKDDVVPAAENELGGPQATLAGLPTSEREFIDAVYGNFPYVLLFVVLLTYVLLMRAFRSVLLPLKAVILNLVSLGAAYGIIVFIFQKGHGAEEIWNVPGDRLDHLVDPADDLRVPVRALDGLRGLHADADARGLRRDGRHRVRRSRSGSRGRASS